MPGMEDWQASHGQCSSLWTRCRTPSSQVNLADFKFKLVQVELADANKTKFSEKYKIKLPANIRARHSDDVVFGSDWRELLADFDSKCLGSFYLSNIFCMTILVQISNEFPLNLLAATHPCSQFRFSCPCVFVLSPPIHPSCPASGLTRSTWSLQLLRVRSRPQIPYHHGRMNLQRSKHFWTGTTLKPRSQGDWLDPLCLLFPPEIAWGNPRLV